MLVSDTEIKIAITIPIIAHTDKNVGLSSGLIIQFNKAPTEGIRNFHMAIEEILTSFLATSIIQIETAPAVIHDRYRRLIIPCNGISIMVFGSAIIAMIYTTTLPINI